MTNVRSIFTFWPRVNIEIQYWEFMCKIIQSGESKDLFIIKLWPIKDTYICWGWFFSNGSRHVVTWWVHVLNNTNHNKSVNYLNFFHGISDCESVKVLPSLSFTISLYSGLRIASLTLIVSSFILCTEWMRPYALKDADKVYTSCNVCNL